MILDNLFDIRTLTLFGGLTALLVAGIMVYVSLARRTYPGFHHWAVGYIVGGVGLLLMSLRHIAPDFISILLANLLVIAQPMLLSRGMAIFVRAPSRTMTESLIMLAMLALQGWFTYFEPYVAGRIIAFNLAFIFFTLRLAVLSARGLPGLPLMGSNWTLVGFSLFFSVWYFLRTILTLIFEFSTSDLMSPSLLQSATFAFSVLANNGISALLIIVNAQRIEAELSQTHQELNRKNIELENTNRELEHLSQRDGLTGLINRRTFDLIFSQEWQRMLRDRRPVSLIMADIDFFKQFNDTYGHLSGDKCIQTVARTIEQTVMRASDVVARYGGEEFVLVLPAVPSAGACTVAKAVQERVREIAIAHQASEVNEYVTLSFGVATMIPQLSSSPKTLLDMADKALYLSKGNGRNQITVLEN